MKLALIVLASILAVVVLRKLFWPATEIKLEGPVASWIIPDAWTLATGDLDGKPIVTRYRDGFTPLIGNPAYPKQLGIAIPLHSPREDGLRTNEEGNQLYEVEDEIRRIFAVANESLCVGVISTKGMREFILYTSNEVAALAKAKDLQKSIKHHQLQIIINHDPEWNVYKNLFSNK